MPRGATRIISLCGALGLAAAGLMAGAGIAAADEENVLSPHVFAAGSSTLSGPDDITLLDGKIFIGWQNGVGAKGEAAKSGNTQGTVVEYSSSGKQLHSWQLTGKIDGMSADPEHDRIIATVNEDGNSSLYVISLKGDEGSKVVHYAYSGLTHNSGNGGTDAPHIYKGQIFISASNPGDLGDPAVYRATLSGSTATLTPVFSDNSNATVANPGGGATTLALSDPDSNNVVPGSSPRFKHDFLLDSQGDGQLIFAQNAGTSSQKLFLLNLSASAQLTPYGPAVDDTVWATASRGTLYATDGSNTVYAIRGRFDVGTAFSAVAPCNAGNAPSTGCSASSWLAKLNLNTGELTPVPGVTVKVKGLLFVTGEGEGGDGSGD